MLPRYAKCEFSAFLSYAHLDDKANPYWITKFCGELQKCLAGKLGSSVVNKSIHFSQRNGPEQGFMTSELHQRVANSFALIIVVGENYPDSAWCLKELEFFRKLFGAPGLEARLHIVALHREAIKRLEGKLALPGLFRDDQIWMPFFREEDPTQPIRTHLEAGILSPEFEGLLLRLASNLAGSIKADLAQKDPAPAEGELDPGRPASDLTSKLRVALGAVTPELKDITVRLAGSLGEHPEFEVAQVPGEALLEFRTPGDLGAAFGEAHVLVLPYSHAAPFVAGVASPGGHLAGGHLALQQQEWERLEKPRWLIWYRPVLEADSVKRPAGPDEAEYIRSLPVSISTPELLLGRLREILAEVHPQEAARSRNAKALVYVESNQVEIDEWKSLSRRIGEVWDDITRSSSEATRIAIRARGLRVHELDRAKHRLDDADGVVLLWGHKPKASLIDQINTVEDLIPYDGPLAPGFVAYLIPPHGDGGRQAAHGWEVLRFRRQADGFREMPDESGQLRGFLEEILRRKRLPPE